MNLLKKVDLENEINKSIRKYIRKTTKIEGIVNNRSRFRNWISRVLEDIRVYTGPH